MQETDQELFDRVWKESYFPTQTDQDFVNHQKYLDWLGASESKLMETLSTLHLFGPVQWSRNKLPLDRVRSNWRTTLYTLTQDQRFDLLMKDPAWFDRWHPRFGSPLPDMPRKDPVTGQRNEFPVGTPRPYPGWAKKDGMT